MEELKPCPFCGGMAYQFGERMCEKNKKEAALMCICCKARGPIVTTRVDAIAAWNKREVKDWALCK